MPSDPAQLKVSPAESVALPVVEQELVGPSSIIDTSKTVYEVACDVFSQIPARVKTWISSVLEDKKSLQVHARRFQKKQKKHFTEKLKKKEIVIAEKKTIAVEVVVREKDKAIPGKKQSVVSPDIVKAQTQIAMHFEASFPPEKRGINQGVVILSSSFSVFPGIVHCLSPKTLSKNLEEKLSPYFDMASAGNGDSVRTLPLVISALNFIAVREKLPLCFPIFLFDWPPVIVAKNLTSPLPVVATKIIHPSIKEIEKDFTNVPKIHTSPALLPSAFNALRERVQEERTNGGVFLSRREPALSDSPLAFVGAGVIQASLKISGEVPAKEQSLLAQRVVGDVQSESSRDSRDEKESRRDQRNHPEPEEEKDDTANT